VVVLTVCRKDAELPQESDLERLRWAVDTPPKEKAIVVRFNPVDFFRCETGTLATSPTAPAAPDRRQSA
jgi:hypothetical protein